MENEFSQNKELKKAMQRIHDNIEIPDSTPSWLKVQARLNKRKRRKQWKRRWKISGAIVVCSFLGSIVISTTTPTAYSQISSLLKRIQNQVIEFFHEEPEPNPFESKTTDMDDLKDKNIVSGTRMDEVTLEDAQSKVSFHLLLPSTVPGSFELTSIRIFGSAEGTWNHAQFEYTNDNGEILNIIQHEIDGKTSGLKVEMPLDAGEYKDIVINGNKAILLIPIEGNANLEWLTEDRIMVRISGKLSESDIINLAKSLH
ncbi:DUF4367 domain-containing protein [Paenibacillus sp. MSJ-34]|uniref:DUF4367 domain-containing protein n=1 Tax=Paenibacillus sp. MSJ-34 TaxID=2841529 RepID=UPI001C121909|nr:DUF4367 domain-containing protein [Paenibacillus sp. MSJ-34]MBU5445652.1 DUF4367 domain-containing protein [Paenibacillus sp. MSJ-34]